MHELSIAMSIVERVTEEIECRNGAKVSAIYIQLGHLSGVVKEALLFSFDMACEGTLLKGSRLVIEELPVVVYCSNCHANQTLASIQMFACPLCNTPTAEIVQGKELDIVALEIEE